MSLNANRSAQYDVAAVGNAIVDVLAPVDDGFLTAHEVAKDAMTLIDEERATALYAAMPPGEEHSGGSAANTVAGVASLGGKALYMGKVADDQLGEVFAHDLRAIGVDYATKPLTGGPATARCLILVTPDAARSMNTFLGASSLLDEKDIDQAAVAAARYTYLEGYLFDRDEAKSAFVRAAEIAKAEDRKVALTLSDTFCVDRHRASFRQLVANHVDIVFANEAELKSLYQTEDFDAAVDQIRSEAEIAFVTRSAKGSVVIAGGVTHDVPAAPIPGELIDTTGAGDQFAAGVLFGLARDKPLVECAKLGSLAAAEVISHFGARPERDLAQFTSETA